MTISQEDITTAVLLFIVIGGLFTFAGGLLVYWIKRSKGFTKE